jgi:RIO kinase 1
MSEESEPTSVDAASDKSASQVKQRFEANEAVQRWLRQTEEEVDPTPAAERFLPAFLANHPDRAWILSSLDSFYSLGMITDVIADVRPGKEATVYTCRAHPRTDSELLAAKVYRPRMFRSLSNDAAYRRNRHVARDTRAERAMRGKTRRGRQMQVSSWIDYEFKAHEAVYAAGADVPRPWAQEGNAVLMGYVGDEANAAPHLREADVDSSQARQMFDLLIDNVRLFLGCNVIHGDLSAYNILYWEGQLTVIDFAQAVDPRTGTESMNFLHRDIERLCDFFRPLGVDASAGAITARLWSDFVYGRL